MYVRNPASAFPSVVSTNLQASFLLTLGSDGKGPCRIIKFLVSTTWLTGGPGGESVSSVLPHLRRTLFAPGPLYNRGSAAAEEIVLLREVARRKGPTKW